MIDGEGVAYAHVWAYSVDKLLAAVEQMDDLEALSFDVSWPSVSTSDPDSLQDIRLRAVMESLKRRTIAIFGVESGNEDFVSAGFANLLELRPRTCSRACSDRVLLRLLVHNVCA